MQYLVSFLCLLLFGCNDNSRATEETALQPVMTDTLPPAAVEMVAETPAGDTFGLNYLMGRFDPASHPAFTRADDRYTNGGRAYYLHRDAYAAFRDMHAAAAADGVKLQIISAARNFASQKGIWEAKWNGERLLEGKESAPQAYPDPADRARAILRYSSMPGTSRHHWGTDIDLNALTNDYFASGEGKKIYDWLQTHAHEYGFCQPYTAKGADRPDGYEEEKWHWSYLPVARPLTRLAREELTADMIDGFRGAEAATAIDVVEKYVLGINPDCLPEQ